MLGGVEDERELVRSADLLVKMLRTSRKESLNYRRWMLVLEKEGELEWSALATRAGAGPMQNQGDLELIVAMQAPGHRSKESAITTPR